MSASDATVYLTKIAAAQRQLDAAIRMAFAGEDELAIHTVLSAAYRIVRDLREKRGRREQPNEAYATGVFYVARAYATGKENELPKPLRKWADNDRQIREFATFIREQLT